MQNLLDTFSWMTFVVLAMAVVGAVKCIVGELSYEEYVRIMDLPVAGVALGRGVSAAYKRRG